jgi:hypothetical protein
MTIIATEGQFARLSALIKFLDTAGKPEMFKDVVTVNDTAATLTLGTVLGKVTATGAFKVAKQAAVDGSQNPAAIYIGDSFGVTGDTALIGATDTKVLVLARGKAIVSKEALKLDASFGTTPQKQAAYDALKAVGILVEASN